MIIFLHGTDTYRIQEKIKEIESRYKSVNKGVLNLEKFNATEIEFNNFLDALNQQSMFVTKKLFFLENVFLSDSFKKELPKYIDEISKSTDILVLVERTKIKNTLKLFKLVQEKSVCQEFEALSGVKLKNWVQKEFSKYGSLISPFALNRLISFTGTDLWVLNNEIKKLSCYTKNITEKEIDLFIKPTIESEIFKTIEELAKKDRTKALYFLENHLREGESPFYILKMFAWQFRNILLVKAGKKSGMHPFVLRKTQGLAQRFSLRELKEIFSKIFQADKDIKTGKILPEPALKMLIATI